MMICNDVLSFISDDSNLCLLSLCLSLSLSISELSLLVLLTYSKEGFQFGWLAAHVHGWEQSVGLSAACTCIHAFCTSLNVRTPLLVL